MSLDVIELLLNILHVFATKLTNFHNLQQEEGFFFAFMSEIARKSHENRANFPLLRTKSQPHARLNAQYVAHNPPYAVYDDVRPKRVAAMGETLPSLSSLAAKH